MNLTSDPAFAYFVAGLTGELITHSAAALGLVEGGIARDPTDGVGCRFRAFTVSNLEMVHQIVASSNPLISWLRRLDELRNAHRSSAVR